MLWSDGQWVTGVGTVAEFREGFAEGMWAVASTAIEETRDPETFAALTLGPGKIGTALSKLQHDFQLSEEK
jgi:hypothetical protein